MGKRLQRYFFNTFPEALERLSGKNASLVMKDGVSIFGKILRRENHMILFEDKIPRLHYIEIKNIYEIVVDSETSY